MKVPCQAAVNNLYFEKIPVELVCLNTSELVFIAKRLSIKKIIIVPKGQTQKMHGSIVHVLVNVNSTRKQLSRQGNWSEVILVKLKKIYHIKACILLDSSATQSKGSFRISSNSESFIS